MPPNANKPENHIHKLKRIVLGSSKIVTVVVNGRKRKHVVKTGIGTPIYKCIQPGCNFKVQRELALGVVTECWVCGESMVVTTETLSLVKPRHYTCRNQERAKILNKALDRAS